METSEVRHGGTDDSSLEPIRLSYKPRSHESPIAPAPNTEPRIIEAIGLHAVLYPCDYVLGVGAAHVTDDRFSEVIPPPKASPGIRKEDANAPCRHEFWQRTKDPRVRPRVVQVLMKKIWASVHPCH